MAITIAIANQKGGVGKTTTAIEIAACLKNLKYKVLVVDLDQQTNLTTHISGNPYQPGIYDVLSSDVEITSTIQSTDEFDLLASSERLSKADKEFGEATDVLKLKAKLKDINDEYDFIIIDNNPTRNVLLNMTYIASDYILIPAEAEEGSFNGIKAVYNDLKKFVEIGWSNAEILGIVITKVENTSMHEYGKEKIAEIVNEMHSNAFIETVHKSIAASECKTEGTSMQTGKKKSKPATDYRRITKTLLQQIIE